MKKWSFEMDREKGIKRSHKEPIQLVVEFKFRTQVSCRATCRWREGISGLDGVVVSLDK